MVPVAGGRVYCLSHRLIARAPQGVRDLLNGQKKRRLVAELLSMKSVDLAGQDEWHPENKYDWVNWVLDLGFEIQNPLLQQFCDP